MLTEHLVNVKPASLPLPVRLSVVCFNTNPYKLASLWWVRLPMRLGTPWGGDLGLALLGIRSRMVPAPHSHLSTAYRTLSQPWSCLPATSPSASAELCRGDEKEGCSLPRQGNRGPERHEASLSALGRFCVAWPALKTKDWCPHTGK